LLLSFKQRDSIATEHPIVIHEALLNDIREFTEAIINGRHEADLEAKAQILTLRHQLTLDELRDLVYRRLLLLAQFCYCCESQEGANNSRIAITSVSLLVSPIELDQFDGSTISERHEFAEMLFKEAFDHPRNARSGEYKQGVKAGIYSMFELAKVDCSYRAGTASFDAFFSGLSEGQNIARPYTTSPGNSQSPASEEARYVG
jgi:hypothetical protein